MLIAFCSSCVYSTSYSSWHRVSIQLHGMSKFIKHRAQIWCLVLVRQDFFLVFRFHPHYSSLCSFDKGREDCFDLGISGDLSRNFMHPLLVHLFAMSWLMDCVVLKEETSARPGCNMYSARLVFVSHRARSLTKLPILLLPLAFKNVRPWLPLGSKKCLWLGPLKS